jgi:hypothetical protein
MCTCLLVARLWGRLPPQALSVSHMHMHADAGGSARGEPPTMGSRSRAFWNPKLNKPFLRTFFAVSHYYFLLHFFSPLFVGATYATNAGNEALVGSSARGGAYAALHEAAPTGSCIAFSHAQRSLPSECTLRKTEIFPYSLRSGTLVRAHSPRGPRRREEVVSRQNSDYGYRIPHVHPCGG